MGSNRTRFAPGRSAGERVQGGTKTVRRPDRVGDRLCQHRRRCDQRRRSGDHRAGSAQNLAFFWAVGVAQLVWGAITLVRAPQWWLALGALGNAVVVATWVVSRTVGLPFGDLAGVVLPVGFPDGLATVFEAVTVVGATGWRFGDRVRLGQRLVLGASRSRPRC